MGRSQQDECGAELAEKSGTGRLLLAGEALGQSTGVQAEATADIPEVGQLQPGKVGGQTGETSEGHRERESGERLRDRICPDTK